VPPTLRVLADQVRFSLFEMQDVSHAESIGKSVRPQWCRKPRLANLYWLWREFQENAGMTTCRTKIDIDLGRIVHRFLEEKCTT
jgi:hypothetical protein